MECSPSYCDQRGSMELEAPKVRLIPTVITDYFQPRRMVDQWYGDAPTQEENEEFAELTSEYWLGSREDQEDFVVLSDSIILSQSLMGEEQRENVSSGAPGMEQPTQLDPPECSMAEPGIKDSTILSQAGPVGEEQRDEEASSAPHMEQPTQLSHTRLPECGIAELGRCEDDLLDAMEDDRMKEFDAREPGMECDKKGTQCPHKDALVRMVTTPDQPDQSDQPGVSSLAKDDDMVRIPGVEPCKLSTGSQGPTVNDVEVIQLNLTTDDGPFEAGVDDDGQQQEKEQDDDTIVREDDDTRGGDDDAIPGCDDGTSTDAMEYSRANAIYEWRGTKQR